MFCYPHCPLYVHHEVAGMFQYSHNSLSEHSNKTSQDMYNVKYMATLAWNISHANNYNVNFLMVGLVN